MLCTILGLAVHVNVAGTKFVAEITTDRLGTVTSSCNQAKQSTLMYY